MKNLPVCTWWVFGEFLSAYESNEWLMFCPRALYTPLGVSQPWTGLGGQKPPPTVRNITQDEHLSFGLAKDIWCLRLPSRLNALNSLALIILSALGLVHQVILIKNFNFRIINIIIFSIFFLNNILTFKQMQVNQQKKVKIIWIDIIWGVPEQNCRVKIKKT